MNTNLKFNRALEILGTLTDTRSQLTYLYGTNEFLDKLLSDDVPLPEDLLVKTTGGVNVKRFDKDTTDKRIYVESGGFKVYLDDIGED